MSARFDIAIQGIGVAPDTVRLDDLLDILTNIKIALVATAVEAGYQSSEINISLADISAGSNILTFAGDEKLTFAAKRCATAVLSNDTSGIPRARHGLRQLWKKAHAKNWEIGFQPTNGIPRAVIHPNVELDSHHLISGSTTIFGRILRVGGIPNPTATVRFPNGDRLTVSIAGEKIAQELGHALYRVVALEGEARWSAQDWFIDDFRVISVGPFDERLSIEDGLSSLADIAGDYWDEIDPQDYINDLRSD